MKNAHEARIAVFAADGHLLAIASRFGLMTKPGDIDAEANAADCDVVLARPRHADALRHAAWRRRTQQRPLVIGCVAADEELAEVDDSEAALFDGWLLPPHSPERWRHSLQEARRRKVVEPGKKGAPQGSQYMERTVAEAAAELLESEQVRSGNAIRRTLEKMGRQCMAEAASFVTLSPNGSNIVDVYEWRNADGPTLVDRMLGLPTRPVASVLKRLAQKEVLALRAEELLGEFYDRECRDALAGRVIRVVPAFVQSRLYGALILSSREAPCPWTSEERELVHVLVRIFVASLERERTQEQLSEARTRLDSILTSVTEFGIAALNADNRFIHFNPMAERLTGLSADDVIGRTVHELRRQTGQPSAEFDDALREAQLGGRTLYEFVRKDVNNPERTFEITVMPMRGGDGNDSGSVVFFRDITARKQAEQLERAQRQFLVQVDKMTSLGTLVSGVAHEINNPNQFVMMSCSLLRKAWEGVVPILEEYHERNGGFMMGGLEYAEMREELPRMLARIMEGAERIRYIVEELREYSRHDAEMSHEDVDVRTVLRSAVLLLSNTIRKSTQNFQTIYPEDLPHVHGNFRRLEQVFINLVQNACQALPDHARAVRVHAFYDGENRNVVVRVEDEGVGISESEASRITDPFYTTRRESGGTGLGLSVSLSIIQEHHGTLSFSSEPGEGACATVALPAVLETAKQRENASRKAEAVQKESEDAGLS